MHDIDPPGWNRAGKERSTGCANILILFVIMLALLLPILLSVLKSN